MANMRQKLYRKHRYEQTLEIPGLGGGLNVMTPEDRLKPNEFSLGMNTFIDLNGLLTVRPGIEYMCNSYQDGYTTDDICEINFGAGPLVAVANHNSVYIAAPSIWQTGVVTLSSLDHFDIGGGDSTQLVPFYGSAQPRLLAAKGGRIYAASSPTTAVTINGAGAPDKVVSMTTAYNRIFAVGDGTYPNRLFISAPGDCTTTAFDSTGGNAEYIDMSGKCMAVCRWGKLIVVFMESPRSVIRLDVTNPDPANWAVERKEAIIDAGAVNKYCMVEIGSDLYFLDSDGLKSMQGLEQYGDVGIGASGVKIKNLLSIEPTTARMWHDPNKGYLAVKPTVGKIFSYHYLYDAWAPFFSHYDDLRWDVQFGRYISAIDSMFYQVLVRDTGTMLPLVGHLAHENYDLASDYGPNGSYSVFYPQVEMYSSILVPKVEEAPSDWLVSWIAKEVVIKLIVVRSGTINIYLQVNGATATKTVETAKAITGATMLADATTLLVNATGPLNEETVYMYKKSGIMAVGRDFRLKLTSTDGARFAFVGAQIRVARRGRN